MNEDMESGVYLAFDTENQIVGLGVHSVQITTMWPRPNETPFSFAYRCYDAIRLAKMVENRMQSIISHRESLIPADVWEKDQARIHEMAVSE